MYVFSMKCLPATANKAAARINLVRQGINLMTIRTRMQYSGPVINRILFLCYSGVHRVLVGKPEGKRPLWRPRRRWEDNINMDLQEVGGVVGTGWSWLRIGTWWRALVGTVRNFRVP